MWMQHAWGRTRDYLVSHEKGTHHFSTHVHQDSEHVDVAVDLIAQAAIVICRISSCGRLICCHNAHTLRDASLCLAGRFVMLQQVFI